MTRRSQRVAQPSPADGAGSVRLRALRPLAVLPGEMPVLRLQQPRRARGRGSARGRALWFGAIDRYADELGPRRLDTIFFGGGTPSLMAPATVAAVIERATARFAPAPDLEITLEANPTSTEAARLRDFRAAGVNRVSLGVQALDDDALRFLGREHTAAEALAAVDLAARLFPRFSFDLIYARPGQTPAAWAAELERALAPCRRASQRLSADHRARHALPSPRPNRRAADARRRGAGGSLRVHPGACSPPPALPPTRSPTTPARARPAGTT